MCLLTLRFGKPSVWFGLVSNKGTWRTTDIALARVRITRYYRPTLWRHPRQTKSHRARTRRYISFRLRKNLWKAGNHTLRQSNRIAKLVEIKTAFYHILSSCASQKRQTKNYIIFNAWSVQWTWTAKIRRSWRDSLIGTVRGSAGVSLGGEGGKKAQYWWKRINLFSYIFPRKACSQHGCCRALPKCVRRVSRWLQIPEVLQLSPDYVTAGRRPLNVWTFNVETDFVHLASNLK